MSIYIFQDTREVLTIIFQDEEVFDIIRGATLRGASARREKKLRRHCAKQRLMNTMFDEILSCTIGTPVGKGWSGRAVDAWAPQLLGEIKVK